jgi:hypothetical protein
MKSYTFIQYLVGYFVERKILHTKLVKKIKTYVYVDLIYKNLAVCGMMWKRIAEGDTPHLII